MWNLEESLLTRSRILNIINSIPHFGTIAWIVGPLGAGKSTVALQWARELGADVQLISARPLQLGEGSQQHPPDEFGLALQNLLNVCSRDREAATQEEITESLDHVIELSRKHTQPFILDDLELIRRDSMNVLRRLFVELLSELRINRALFISRTIDANILGALQEQRSLRMVLPSTLEFDQEETAEAYRLGVFGTATMEQVERARERSAGWIAGMLSELHGHGGRSIAPSQFNTNVLNNMVLRQPPRILRALFAGALVPINTIEIFTQWFTHLGIPHWAIPSTLTQLPTRALKGNNGDFEIVPTMKDALLTLVGISVTDEELNPLLSIAMDNYIRNDNPESASALAMERNLESEYLRLIKPVALELSRAEGWQFLANLVEMLPRDVILSDADISFWYTYALAGGTRWSEVVDIQYRVSERTSENPLVRGRNQLMKGFVARAQGDYKEALNHFEQAYHTLPKSAHQERMYAAASAGTSASQIRLGQESLPWRKRTAYELAHLPPRQRWWHGNMGPIALGYIASSGRLEIAYALAEQQVAGLQEHDPDLSWRYLLLMATIDLERMRFDSAAETIEQARPYIQTPLQRQMIMLIESKLLAAQGNYTSAMGKLDLRPYSAGRSINNEFITKLTMASQAFDSGDAATAEITLGSAAWPNDSWPRNFGDAHPNLILALIRAETGEVKQGLEFANQVLEEAKDRRFRSLEIRSHVVLAHIHHESSNAAARDHEVRKAMDLNTVAGYQLIFFVKGQDVRTLAKHHPIVVGNNTYRNRLTSREIEVMRLVAQSFSNKQIAEAMFISVSTVKNHLASVYDKLGTNNRRTAVQLARKYGFVDHHEFL